MVHQNWKITSVVTYMCISPLSFQTHKSEKVEKLYWNNIEIKNSSCCNFSIYNDHAIFFVAQSQLIATIRDPLVSILFAIQKKRNLPIIKEKRAQLLQTFYALGANRFYKLAPHLADTPKKMGKAEINSCLSVISHSLLLYHVDN